MMFENGHPNVTLEQLAGLQILPAAFHRRGHRPEQRPGCLDGHVPLARGGVIAREYLLRQAGHHRGMHLPCGWSKPHPGVFVRDIGGELSEPEVSCQCGGVVSRIFGPWSAGCPCS